MSNRANRVKAILTELDLSIGSDCENEQRLKNFLDEHGYKGYNNINIIKSWYEKFKTNFKKEILNHFNVELTDNDDLDSKLNELLRDQHLGVQNPTFGWLMKWVERTKTKQSTEHLEEPSLDDE